MGSTDKKTLLQGSLDLLVLQALKTGAKHGYAISRHIRERSEDYLQVEEGSLYPALHRLEQRGWVESYWGQSETNRRAKYYELSSDGRKQLKRETEAWRQMSHAINLVLEFHASPT